MTHYGIINNRGEWHSNAFTSEFERIGFRAATKEEWQKNGSKLVEGLTVKIITGDIANQLDELQNKWNDIDQVKARYDELGKVIQTITGNGTIEDPYKGWKVGMSVEANKWYYATDPSDPDNPYLWMAIKSGYPASAVDAEYFDVVL